MLKQTPARTLCQHTSGFVAQHQQLIKTHRSLLLSNDNFPPEEHRLNLIQNFIQAYSWYFKRTVYDVLRYLRLEETFDFLKTHCSLSRRLWWQYKCCVLSLRDGIPPFGRRGEREPRSCEEPRGSPTDTSFTKLGRSLNPDIIGTMRIGWTMEDYCIWRKWEYSRLTPGCRKYQGNLERQIQNGWFGDFQDLVENGLTYTQPAGGRTWSLGTFKKTGE